MRQYIRSRHPGATYFFTLVTYRREPIFKSEEIIRNLKKAFCRVLKERPFELVAIVVLPDHLHAIWTLPSEDFDYSTRWRLIKTYFTRSFQTSRYPQKRQSISRMRKGEQPVWQRRFREHQIRDEQELERYFDYIHFNPIKHGIVADLSAYRWSSYHRYVRLGVYAEDWIERVKMDEVPFVGE